MAIEIRHAEGHRYVQKTVAVRRPPGELYDCRHQLERLPRLVCECSVGVA